MESENKLMFLVDMRAKKTEIKKAVEESFKVKVIQLNTYIGPDGKKRAYVKLSPETPAIDVATKLGLM
jgi:large subunit ribosomal protein L23Ae